MTNAPQVDFYLLTTPQPQSRFHFACQIIEKAYRKKHPIYVFTETPTDAKTIDNLLWTFRDISFIPHHIQGEMMMPSPIIIGYDAPTNENNNNDVLINLTASIPIFFSQFRRIIEIIPEHSDWRAKARENYRKYRGSNCTLQTHDLKNY